MCRRRKCRNSTMFSMFRNTVVRPIKDLSANLKHQLSDKACAFDFYSIACDESADATDTAQLLIILRGVDDNFCVKEELLDLRSLKGTTYRKGKDIFETVSDAIDQMGLEWDKMCGVTTDGAPAMKGDRKGMVCAKVRSEAVYLTSSEWPSPLYIFLYVALRKKSLDTPVLG
ncbi:Uncharacterised protein r2_g304 [Pycnogonum litorale]